jgi:hypothetical protein
MQPWYADLTRDGGKAIFYSAGNFISGQAYYSSPSNPNHHRTATGDGVVFQVWLHEVDGELRIHSIDPILISNYNDRQKGMVVRKMSDIITDPQVSEGWKKFYRRRLFVMNRHSADPTEANLLR